MEKNVVEAKESFDVLCTSNDLPENHVPRLRSDLDELAQEAGSLAKRLLRCLALDLQIDSEQFLGEHSGMLTGDGNNGSSLRLLHYPPTDEHQHYSVWFYKKRNLRQHYRLDLFLFHCIDLRPKQYMSRKIFFYYLGLLNKHFFSP